MGTVTPIFEGTLCGPKALDLLFQLTCRSKTSQIVLFVSLIKHRYFSIKNKFVQKIMIFLTNFLPNWAKLVTKHGLPSKGSLFCVKSYFLLLFCLTESCPSIQVVFIVGFPRYTVHVVTDQNVHDLIFSCIYNFESILYLP